MARHHPQRARNRQQRVAFPRGGRRGFYWSWHLLAVVATAAALGGSALQEYTRLANDLLFNPEATIDRVKAAYERQLETEGENQQSLYGSTTRVQLEEVREDLAAKADQFEQREERLRERFAGDESS